MASCTENAGRFITLVDMINEMSVRYGDIAYVPNKVASALKTLVLALQTYWGVLETKLAKRRKMVNSDIRSCAVTMSFVIRSPTGARAEMPELVDAYDQLQSKYVGLVCEYTLEMKDCCEKAILLDKHMAATNAKISVFTETAHTLISLITRDDYVENQGPVEELDDGLVIMSSAADDLTDASNRALKRLAHVTDAIDTQLGSIGPDEDRVLSVISRTLSAFELLVTSIDGLIKTLKGEFREHGIVHLVSQSRVELIMANAKLARMDKLIHHLYELEPAVDAILALSQDIISRR